MASLTKAAPARDAASVTPSDATVYNPTINSVWVGGKGDLAVEMVGGGVVTYSNAEGVLPIQVRRILATGTTASAIVAMY